MSRLIVGDNPDLPAQCLSLSRRWNSVSGNCVQYEENPLVLYGTKVYRTGMVKLTVGLAFPKAARNSRLYTWVHILLAV